MEVPTGHFLSERGRIARTNLQNYSRVGNGSLDIQVMIRICRILWNTKALIHHHHHYHHWQNSPFLSIAFLRRFCQICLNYTIRFSLLCTLQQQFVHRARSSALRPAPNLEDQVPVFMSPSYRVVQLYSQALGSLFAAYYDLKGFGGGILTRLYAGRKLITVYKTTHH
jgi:hypothetical protein